MRSNKSSLFKTIYPISLGCPKNKSDFEKLLYVLQKKGCQFTLNPEEADTFWINTCAFIRPAVEESIDHILELAELKKNNQKLIVSGCLPARYSEVKLKELLPEVDKFYGIEPFRYFSEEEPTEKILTESPFYAYLKISEGCNHRCSYCTIPKIRGLFRSKPKELLLREAENLLKQGVKEIILVGQDITFYGKDLGNRQGLLELLKELGHLPYDFRIRLLYLHPGHLSKSFIDELFSLPKVLPYFDIPIQHAHPKILKKMKRFYGPEQILEIIELIRKENPFASIRTTILTGFPGEGEREFIYLLDFLRKAKFDYLGVFTFYPEEGTPASKFEGRVPYKEKIKRKREILKMQREITKEKLKERVGLEEEVLVLGVNEKNKYFGISQGQAPEIDGITYVLFKRSYALNPGDLLKVKIVRSGVYDLWAEPVDLRG
ncbi:MAG: 30S ribosomal protein S12 methylthiotransferase RimO [Caldimicrobium sp.]